MAKSIVTYCDVCLSDDDTYTEGRTIPCPPIGTQTKPRLIDLCEQHEKQYVTPFVELVARLGVTESQLRPIMPRNGAIASAADVVTSEPTPVTHRKPIDETCPICGETYRRASGDAHFSGKHPDESRARVFLEEGLVDEIFECGERGCDDARLSAQGRQMHRLRAHGIKQSA